MAGIRFATVVGLALGFAYVSPGSKSQGATPHSALVSVVDKNNLPTSNLKSEEVRVLEDGVARPVLRVEPATDSFQTVLSDGMGLEPITTVSETSPARFSQVILLADANAIVKACSLLVKSHAARPVVLADFNERGNNIVYHPGVVYTYLPVEQALQRAGAQLWVLVQQSNGPSPPNRLNREIYQQATRASGGRFLLDGLTPEDTAANLEKIRTMLLHQYRVTFARPDSAKRPTTFDVKVSRPGTSVSAPSWPPE
jgi:hypothetical protein